MELWDFESCCERKRKKEETWEINKYKVRLIVSGCAKRTTSARQMVSSAPIYCYMIDMGEARKANIGWHHQTQVCCSLKGLSFEGKAQREQDINKSNILYQCTLC